MCAYASLSLFNLYLRFSSVSALNFIFLFVLFFAIEYFIADYFHYFKNVRDILSMRTITRPTIWICSWVCSLSSLTAFWCNNRNGNQIHFRPTMTTMTVVAAATTTTTITAATTVDMYSYTQTVVRNKFISLCKIFAVYHSAVWYFLPLVNFNSFYYALFSTDHCRVRTQWIRSFGLLVDFILM